jgi:two-component system chemotaxis sensor kinase CheA
VAKIGMSMDAALQVFIDESQELLAEMESGLLACERNASSAEIINSIFRAAHTIKGSSGLFGLDPIVSFMHVVETALDRVRVGEVAMDAGLAVLLLACKDHVGALVGAVTAGSALDDAVLAARGSELCQELQTRAGAIKSMSGGARGSATVATSILAAAQRGPDAAASDHWHISVRFKADVLRAGMDPLGFVRYLTTFGEIRGVHVVEEALPAAADLDPEACYIGFELSFKTDAEEARIRSAFEFVIEDCTLALVAPHSPLDAYLRAVPEYPANPALAIELLVRVGSLSRDEALRAPALAAATRSAAVTDGAAARKADRPAEPDKRAPNAERSIRVDAAKLDNLITLIGELIISSASANLGARRANDLDLQETTSRLAALVESVRDSALQLRMVKIGGTFSRFQRVVNDVARELGKNIDLVLNGEDTELDKTVIERIADPLTHLVRNAIDHGIEPAAVRAERGKPATGTITLNAYHDSGSIVIEVGDDGGGLKRDRILAKAVERGLLEPGKPLTDQEVFALIFEPGFSTAEQVTNLSGRGVGMDVVKRNITALRGDIDIRSEEGRGTTVAVRLPLTLAIINGFQIAVGRSVFVVPLDMVDECIEFAPDGDHDYAAVRGMALPFVRLRDFFGLPGQHAGRESIVVVRHAGMRAGLVVDALLGECQTVIKPLARMFGHIRCLSGSSILGNGDVALIIDVAALVQELAGTTSHQPGHLVMAGHGPGEARQTRF